MKKFASEVLILIVFAVISNGVSAQESQTAGFFAAFDFDGNGEVTKDEIYKPASAVDLVIGPKGNAVQLILSTLYHRSSPIETIPYHCYQDCIVTESEDGRKSSGIYSEFVEFAIPVCLGDFFKGFRVVATTKDYLEEIPVAVDRDDNRRHFEFSEGRGFEDDEFFSAVLGCKVALKLGLKIGDEVRTHHGFDQFAETHEEAFNVIGILAPSSSPSDNVVFVNMEGFYLQADHALPIKDENANQERLRRDDEGNLIPLPVEQRELSAVLVTLRKSEDEFEDLRMQMEFQNNKMDSAQAVYPRGAIASVMESTDDIALFYSLRNAILTNGKSANPKAFEENVGDPKR